MSNRSRKAAHYGALAERTAMERHNLEPDRTATHDVLDADGVPGDVKASMLNRRDGDVPRIRLWKDQHRYLARKDGFYVFVPYRAVGRGIQVGPTKKVAARALRVEFYGAGGHRGTSQAKVPVSRLF